MEPQNDPWLSFLGGRLIMCIRDVYKAFEGLQRVHGLYGRFMKDSRLLNQKVSRRFVRFYKWFTKCS